MKEAKAEYIGSPPGTTLIKVKKKPKGISAKIKGTPFELLQIAAVMLETIQDTTGASKKEVVGALLEVVYQDEPENETV